MRQNEIDFPPRLVAPVANWSVLEMSLEMLKNQVFSESPRVVLAQWMPTTRKAHEPGVEAIYLGLFDDFVLAAAVSSVLVSHNFSPGFCPERARWVESQI